MLGIAPASQLVRPKARTATVTGSKRSADGEISSRGNRSTAPRVRVDKMRAMRDQPWLAPNPLDAPPALQVLQPGPGVPASLAWRASVSLPANQLLWVPNRVLGPDPSGRELASARRDRGPRAGPLPPAAAAAIAVAPPALPAPPELAGGRSGHPAPSATQGAQRIGSPPSAVGHDDAALSLLMLGGSPP